MFKRYREAKQNNEDPNTLLNETINGFSPQQKKQWNMFMQSMNNQK